MVSSPDFILGANRLEGINKVLSIYGEITGNKKLYNETVAAKLKQHLQMINSDPFFSQNSQHIWGAISEKHRENLTSFLK
jgi:hypothetical protein